MADENAGFLPLPGGAPAQPALQAPFASMENYLEAREYQTMVSALNDLPDDHPHYLSNNEVRKAEVIAGQVLNVTSLPGFENPYVQLIANENPGVQHVLDILNARFDNLENNMNNRLDILTQLTAQNTKDSAVLINGQHGDGNTVPYRIVPFPNGAFPPTVQQVAGGPNFPALMSSTT